MKKRTIATSLIGLTLMASLLYFIAIPRLSVAGTGTVTAYPDEADVSFSVQTQNQLAACAAAQNGVIMSRVYAALLAVGVNTSEIKTTSYSLSPMYDSYNSSKLVGYIAVNSLEVIITGAKNLPNVGNIVDAIVRAGVNEVDGISFTFTDSNYDTLRAEAYQKAIQDAHSQASAIISALGGVIIGIASISTNFGYGIVPQPMVYSGSQAIQPPTPISPGPQLVTATVSITYLYL